MPFSIGTISAWDIGISYSVILALLDLYGRLTAPVNAVIFNRRDFIISICQNQWPPGLNGAYLVNDISLLLSFSSFSIYIHIYIYLVHFCDKSVEVLNHKYSLLYSFHLPAVITFRLPFRFSLHSFLFSACVLLQVSLFIKMKEDIFDTGLLNLMAFIPRPHIPYWACCRL